MADKEFGYLVVGDEQIFDEKANTFLAMRKVAWGNNPDPEKAKLELRKWHMSADGKETPSKGFSFLTEDGPNILTHILLTAGFGRTETVIRSIKDREDFESSLNKVLGPDHTHYNEDIDMQTLYVPGDDIFG